MKNDSPPRRFKLTVGTEELRFNQIQIETVFIDERPVLHMVHKGIHFSVASFLKSQTTQEIWRMLLQLWSLLYLGPPDFSVVDQGSNYTSKEMRENLDAEGFGLKEVAKKTLDPSTSWRDTNPH